MFRFDASEPNFCRCKTHVACSRNAIHRLNELDKDIAFDHFVKEVRLYFLSNCISLRLPPLILLIIDSVKQIPL